MKKYLSGIFCFCCLYGTASAQLLPQNQPEQDACNALLLCGNSFYTPYSYQGYGAVMDLSNTPCSGGPGASPAKEDNSVWLKLNVNTPGTIIFNITPVVSSDDYDWAIVNITNKSCSNLTASDVIRCNFNNNYPIQNNGVTGLNMTSTETGVTSGTTGHSYCKFINAQAGDVYLIMINNFGVFGNISSGFTIDFSGSTATFNNDGTPHFLNIQHTCNTRQQVLLNLNKPVACNSIASNGSDFLLTPAGNISSAQGINCSGNQGYTQQIAVNFNPPLAPGSYALHARAGTDGNTLLDLCGNALTLPDSAAFNVPDLDSTLTVTICANQLPYTWHGQVITQGGQSVAQASFPNQTGCDSIVTLNLHVTDTIKHIQDITVCPGQMPYVWNGITVQNAGPAAATYYTLSSGGCDSLAILNLTVQHPYSHVYSLEGCGSVDFNGITYYQTAIVTDTVVSSIGCDSVYATLHITVHPVNPVTISRDTAGCGSVDFQGHEYTQSAVLRDTVFNAYGCDSLYRVTHIIVYPNTYEPHEYNIADCDSVSFEGKTYVNDITLVDTFQNILGCDSAVRTVNIHPEHFRLSLTADPEEPTQGVYLILTAHANVPDYTISSWMPPGAFPNQTAYEQHLLAGTSTVYEITGKSALGCTDTAVLPLKVDSLIPVAVMPNAFSPNGDGLNDVFKPDFINKNGYKINVFRIFNRYGQVVYKTGAVADGGWNGLYYNNGKPAESGVYYYYIEVEFVNGKKLFYKGDVTLVR